ncbi:MAG: tetratricopeptide repeat protein [Nitrospiria bacterium]
MNAGLFSRFPRVVLCVVFLLFCFFSVTAAAMPEDPESYFNEGMQLDKERHFGEAIQKLTRAVELNLESNKYHQALFLTYTQSRQGLQAIQAYKDMEKKYPKSPAVRYWLGRLYLDSGNLPGAAKEFKAASNFSPKDDHPLISLGHVYSRMGQDKEALTAYMKANQISPHLAVVHTGMGSIYYKQKDFSRARKEYEEALKLDSSFEEARYNLSLIYEKQGEIDRAVKEWKFLLDADPNESKIRERLAWVYYRRGQYRDAVREYSMLSEVNQNSPEIYFILGKSEILLAAQTSDPDERKQLKNSAIEAFQHTVTFDPSNRAARDYLNRLNSPASSARKK